MVCGIFAFFSLGVVNSQIIVFCILPVAALSEMINPTLKAFMSNTISNKHQGLLQGVLSSIVGLTSILGPIFMTFIFQFSSSSETKYYLPGAPFLLAGTLFIFSLLILQNSLDEEIGQDGYRPS
jgi:DHA1 family tetracycline resistance protein-like MFS transporter